MTEIGKKSEEPIKIESKEPKQNKYFFSSKKTVTFTVPRISIPKYNFRQLFTKSEILMIIVVMIVGVIGGFVGGLFETSQYKAQVLMGSTSNQLKLVHNNDQLIIGIAKKLSPSVVSVDAQVVSQSTNSANIFGFGNPVEEESEGSGIIISTNGLILTNRHVVPAGTKSVSVTLSNGVKLSDVKVVGRTSINDDLDIAILKIENTQGQKLQPAVLGNSNDVEVGDEVVAIGNALGEFHNTVTSGIISGYGRNITASSSQSGDSLLLPTSGTSENLNDLFQTDAAINEGNSGGPLVNLNGQVIGINTAIASNSQNIGFSIPINDVKGLIKEVITTGKFERPFLGVRYLPITLGVKQHYNLKLNNGAYIPKGSPGTPSIISGSAAQKAGLKPGDIITKVDNTPVNLKNDLSSLIDLYEPGAKITLTIFNGIQTKNITVTLGVAP